MKTKKTTKVLFLVSIVAVIFNLARLDAWGATILLYLIWNLFLAWIPYIISMYLIKEDTQIKYFIPLFVVWILFFPNAPYLVTDIRHISEISPNSPALWYDSMVFFLFGLIGLLLGMLSLSHIHQYLKKHINYFLAEASVLAICFLSSFGVYLGRFERWNSWDVFMNPLDLVKHSFSLSTSLVHTGTPLWFVIVFTIFLYCIYKFILTLIA